MRRHDINYVASNEGIKLVQFYVIIQPNLQTAVASMKKAEKFNLIVSEDIKIPLKDNRRHIIGSIIFNCSKYDSFTTLEGYTVIENPKLSHLFYEHIRAWTPKNLEEGDLKQASDEALAKIEILFKNLDKLHLDMEILKQSQLSKDVSLKIVQFVYEQLCKFSPEKIKGKTIFVILYEYYKRYIIGDKNPASWSLFLGKEIIIFLQYSKSKVVFIKSENKNSKEINNENNNCKSN
ncbi:hypothetical protein RFI_31590 [Reticulomyxa filosa]|uniref:Uncharacterized protein n=1 Tax=Reticulomyxa filosa TaxID=46433 RepID=X6LV57_RETFI|nr:hypothetical protein RFI_31590 [Reticulomyxa filosa]|eukprot:ETO05808.1 hypothetical protein RFI_31590 [Reticulomyxa filosa]